MTITILYIIIILDLYQDKYIMYIKNKYIIQVS